MIRTYIAAGRNLEAFHACNDFVRSIRGPIGSGKTSACCAEIIRRAHEQRPSPDGRRKSRWAVIRNTYGELRTTTIKTWHHWFPEALGRFSLEAPITHRLVTDALDIEMVFLALDRPADVSKLLSLELTGGWVNEAREVPKAVVDALTGRVGRFPPVSDGGPTWSGVFLDTMSPDTDHWLYRLAEEEQPDGYQFFAQPSGLSPGAENLDNLPAGRSYYERLIPGKSEEWVRVYIHGDYGYVGDDRPVYPEFKAVHIAPEPLEPSPDLPLLVGVDFGLTPAALCAQRTATGQWRWIAELVTEDMGAVRFAEHLSAMLQQWFPRYHVEGWGDPAGSARSQTDEKTALDIMTEYTGVNFQPAPSNDFTMRREAVAGALNRMVDGEPGLLVSPACKVARKGMAGRYAYRRVQVSGDERYHDKPDKNFFSHVCEAGQYLMLGAGEHRVIMRKRDRVNPAHLPTQAESDYNIHEW